jgi:serine/threonine protein kinase
MKSEKSPAMTARAPDGPPTRLAGGKYRLVRKLASGGMGDVWLARNESTGADVAVKLCADARQDRKERIRHEARVGAMLSHRSVVRVYDLVEEPDGTLALLMELLRGETFGRYLETRGPLPVEEALAVLIPILRALEHAHALGIVHRDVTPQNVVLAIDPDGYVTPKLVDFGIARLPADAPSTLEGQVLGTPRYLAPERIRGDETLDGRSDLFSVGVILCEALTGVSPFAASTPSASLAAVLERHVDPDPRIDAALWVEIQRAIAKRPYERHRSGKEMADALLSATGEDETRLAGVLQAALGKRRDQPGSTADRPLPALAEPLSFPAESSPRRSAPADARPSVRRMRGLRVGVASAMLALVAIAAALAVVSRPRSDSIATRAGFAPSSEAPAIAPGPDTAVVAAPPRVVDRASDASSPWAPASAPSRMPPARSRSPRTVATTPGF